VAYFQMHPDIRCEENYEDGKHTYTFIGPCTITGKEQRVTVLGHELFKYNQGALAQDAFPNLDVYQREWLITGTSEEGWLKTFPPIDSETNMATDEEKLNELTKLEGYDDPMDLLEENAIDSVCPGICVNDGCSYTTEVEPDSDSGWCENCGTNTVKSAMILAGII